MLIFYSKLFKYKYLAPLQTLRFMCEFESKFQIFTKYFNFSYSDVKPYFDSNKLAITDAEHVMKNINFCEGLGFTKANILDNPVLLRYNPVSLEQYYLVMKEGGFDQITAFSLGKFRTLCNRPVDFLKEIGFIKKETNIAESFIHHLNPCPPNFCIQHKDSDLWSHVHKQILIEYLKWRLQVSTEHIEKLLFVHSSLQRKSFQVICENIAIAEELGFTPSKMIKYGYILHSYPKYTKAVLEKYPNLAGTSIKRAMRMYPKLFMVSPANIEKIYNLLKDNNISEEAMQKRMNVFHMSPETIKFRLEELKKNPEMKVLLHNPNILKLIVHHNRARSRLLFLKELQLKCTGVSLLGNDNSKFDIHIREGRDSNTSTDTLFFLKALLKCGTDKFEDTLRKHPYFLHIPLTSLEETFNLLQKHNFTLSAIRSTVYILLYPAQKIEVALRQVQNFEKKIKTKLVLRKKLDLIVYFIEREYHFTGDGIWMNKCLQDEEET